MRQLFADLRRVVEKRPVLAARLNGLKGSFYLTLGWLSLLEFLKLVQELPYKLLLDHLTSGKIMGYAFAFCALQSIAKLCVRYVFITADTHRIHFLESFRTAVFSEGHRKELELDMSWHARHGTGEKEAVIAKNMEKVLNLADSAVFEALPTWLLICFTSIAMLVLGWQYMLVAVVTLACYVSLLFILEPRLAPMREEYRNEERRFEEFGSQVTQGVKTIKGFGLESHFLGKLDGFLGTFLKNEVPRHHRWLLNLSIPEMLLEVSSLAIQALGIFLFYKKQINLSSFVLSVIWMSKVFSNYNRLTRFQHQLHRGLPALRELIGIMLIEPSVAQCTVPQWPSGIRAHVELRDVSFSYPDGKQDALSGISLTIPENSVVAVIGKSGSGKTTLADILTRNCDPTSGAVLVDGVDLRTLDYQRWREEFCAAVYQNATLFDTTIAENIGIARSGATRDDIVHAAQMAYADEFIGEMRDGYETMVGEEGVRLSGGQRQRLSIARAFIRNAKLLVLDEPTSALDGGSQQRVKQALIRLTTARQSTIVIIAHRFSTIEMADTIVVMDQGKVVEVGSHEELVRLNGFYARMRQLETEGAFEDELAG